MADFFQMHASCSDDYGLRKIFKHCKRPCVGQWWYLDRVFECGSSVSHICFDSTGERLATGSNDGKVRIFDLTTQQDPRVVYYGYQQPRVINCVRPVSCLSFYPLGKYIATGSDGCDWRILDLTKGQEPKLRYYYCTTTSICFDSSGNFLATASDDGKVRIFNFGNWSEYWVNDNKCFVYSVSFDPAGKRLAIGSSDGKARVFHLERKEKNCEFCPNSRGCVCSVCFDLTGKYLATASSYEAYIFDLRKKCQLMVFSHADVVNSVCFDPAGKYLATGSAKGKAHIFDVAIQKEVMMFNHGGCRVNAACFDFSGKRLATGSSGCKARIFNWFKKQTLHQVMLKKIILLWLQVKKPDKKIISIEALFTDMAQLFSKKNEETKFLLSTLSQKELRSTWKTFPINMQYAMWNTIKDRINRYGK